MCGKVITRKMLQEARDSTKIRVVKDGKVTGAEVKAAFKDGMPPDQRGKMVDRCVTGTRYLVADGNLAPLSKGVGPTPYNACVMSATDYRLPENHFEEQQHRADVSQQARIFAEASIEDGCNMLVDCAFGHGVFIAGLPPAEQAKAREIFAEAWVAEMVKITNKHPDVVVVFGYDPKLTPLISEKLKQVAPGNNRIIATDAMSLDATHKGHQNGFKVGARIAGDPSGIVGQNTLAIGEERDAQRNLVEVNAVGQIAQEEQFAAAGDLAILGIDAQRSGVPIIEVT